MEFAKKQELFQTVIEKAWGDSVFKQELIDSPKEAIEKLTNTKLTLPEGTRIEVTDQTDASYSYINIPRKFVVDDLELEDEELEMVAGGIVFITSFLVATIGLGWTSYNFGQSHRE